MNIKILIISTVNLRYGGGMSNVIMNYYNAMDRSDVQIDFAAGKCIDENLKNELETEGSKIYSLNSRNNKPLQYVRDLTKIIKNGKYDIVHAHGNSCTLAAEMYSAKKGGAKVRIAHCHNSTCEHIIIHRMLRKLFDKNYTNAFACGEKAGEWLYNGKPFTVINNGVDVNLFAYNQKVRDGCRERYKLQGKKVIGHIGHFSYQKNHEFLIDIFEELFKHDKSYRLMLIGDGELRTSIAKKVHDLELLDTVIFTGKTLDVPKLLQAIDILVMPSRFEGLPLALVEAQTACLPCFVSDAVSKEAGITDLVRFISLEKSAKEWADQINAAPCINREESKNDVCSEIVDAGYSIKDNAANLKRLYLEFLNSNQDYKI